MVQPSCQTSDLFNAIGSSNYSISDNSKNNINDNYCEMLNYNDTYVTCSCNICTGLVMQQQQLGRRNRYLTAQTKISGDSSFAMQVMSMTNYVLVDFTEVLAEAPLIWKGETYEATASVLLFITIVWFFVGITIGMAEKKITNEKYHKLNQNKIYDDGNNDINNDDTSKIEADASTTPSLIMKNANKSNHDDDGSSSTGTDSDVKNIDVLSKEKERINAAHRLLEYIQEIFPIVYSTKDLSLWSRLFTELQNDHLIMKLYNEKENFMRYAYHYEFFTMINITLMMAAIVTSIEMSPDTGECMVHDNQEDCLIEVNIYDHRSSRCTWDDDLQVCNFNDSNTFNWTTVIVSAVIALVIAVPIRIALYCIFELVLRAPTKIKTDTDDDDKIRKQSVVPLALRRASRSVINMARIARKKLNKVKSGLFFREKITALPSNIKDKRDVAIEYFNVYRHDHIESHAGNGLDYTSSESESDSDFSEVDYNIDRLGNASDDDNQETPHLGRNLNKSKSKTVESFSSFIVGEKRRLGLERDTEARQIYSLLHQDIEKYIADGLRLGLPVNKKFLQAWNIMLFGKGKTDVKVGLNPDQLNVHFNAPQQVIDAIKTTIQESEKLLADLQALPPSAAGAQLLRHFVIDLLGRDTPDALIFAQKSGLYIGSTNIVTDQFKKIMFAFVAILNMFCVFTCILFGAIKGPEWQMVWMFLCFLTIFFLIIVDMSFESMMIGFVIPSQTIGSVRKVQVVLNQALLGHCLPDGRIRFHTHANSKNNNDKGFSASSYLHVSHHLAKHLKWLPESSFVLSYVDPLPQVEFQSLNKAVYNRSDNDNNHSGNNRVVIPQGNSRDGNATNIDYGKRTASFFSKLTVATALIYVVTCPIILQRVLVTLPSPVICSFFGMLVALVANTEAIIWISVSVVICSFVFFSMKYFYDYLHDIYVRFHERLKLHKTEFSKEQLDNCIIKAVQRNMKQVEYTESSTFDQENVNLDMLEEENEGNLQSIKVETAVQEERRRASIARRHHSQKEHLRTRLARKAILRLTDARRSSIRFGERRLSGLNRTSFRERVASFNMPSINETKTIVSTSNIATNSDEEMLKSPVEKMSDGAAKCVQDRHEITDDDDTEVAAWLANRRKSQALLSSPTLEAVISPYVRRRPSIFFDDSANCTTRENSTNVQNMKLANIQLEVEQDRIRTKSRKKIQERLALRLRKSEDWLLSSDEASIEEYSCSSDDETNEDTNDGEIVVRVSGNKSRKNVKKRKKTIRKSLRSTGKGKSRSSNINTTTTATKTTRGNTIQRQTSMGFGLDKVAAAKRILMPESSIRIDDSDTNSDEEVATSAMVQSTKNKGSRVSLQRQKSSKRMLKTQKSFKMSVKGPKKSKK